MTMTTTLVVATAFTVLSAENVGSKKLEKSGWRKRREHLCVDLFVVLLLRSMTLWMFFCVVSALLVHALLVGFGGVIDR